MPGQTIRLCLLVTADAGTATGERLSAVLDAADIASVILRPPASRPLEAAITRSLVAIIQKAGVAALLHGDARLARTIKADGVHLAASPTPAEVYAEAREILGGGAIVGMDAATSRHDAMMLGEAGADYIGFAVPPPASNEDRARRLEQVDWWAEIFEPPCMALDVASPEEAAALADAGVDFVAVALADGVTVAETRDIVMAYMRAIGARVATEPGQ